MRLVLSFIAFLITASSLGQSDKYWVYITDKEGVEFNPYEYFDQKAIDRRLKLGLDLYDQTDFPINESYLNSISEIADSTCHHTRWFNAVAVFATPNQLVEIESLPFVREVEAFSRESMLLAENNNDDYLSERGREMLKTQTERMGRSDFATQNINGSGMRIAILDGGFKGVDKHPMFHHIRSRNGILKTYDFIKNKENAYVAMTHGTAVLSCIAGIYRDEYTLRKDTFGLATGAEFLLARTEKRFVEVFSEEENWLAAVEWADKHGADIINSSLGYTGQRYLYKDLDGKTALVSRAGNLAAKKGILVVNSAGNEGSDPWNFIGAPADADSVLAVGGIEPFTGVQTSFSSVGPNYLYKTKPNVTGVGHVMAANEYDVSETQGTSFSSPLVAGFAACVWQLNPDWTCMEVFKALEQGSDLYPYFDYAHGYGVPVAENFLQTNSDTLTVDSTISCTIKDGELIVEILNPSDKERNNQAVWERTEDGLELNPNKNKWIGAKDYEDYLFVHFRNEKNQIISYKVIDMLNMDKEIITIPYQATHVMYYYEGYTETLKIKR